MSRLFGTDGVRGVANTELTPELAMKLGAAGAYVLTEQRSYRPTIMVGCDTRISGGMLANALMAGICSVGANAVYVGVLPTPAIAYLTRKYKVDAGVVISASHNPVEFNGIKFFNSDGFAFFFVLKRWITSSSDKLITAPTFKSFSFSVKSSGFFSAFSDVCAFASRLRRVFLASSLLMTAIACHVMPYSSASCIILPLVALAKISDFSSGLKSLSPLLFFSVSLFFAVLSAMLFISFQL